MRVLTGVLLLMLCGPWAGESAACAVEGTLTFADGVPAAGEFFVARQVRVPTPVAVVADATGHFSIADLPCGKYHVNGPVFGGAQGLNVEIRRSPERVKWVIPGPSWTPTTGAGTTVAEDEQLAEQARVTFLQQVSADDWYVCYTRERHPQLQREMFARVLAILWASSVGEELPPEANSNCNTPNAAQAGNAASRSALQRLRSGVTTVLQQAWRTLGLPEAAFLAGATAEKMAQAATANTSRLDEDEQAVLSARTAAAIVRQTLGDAEGDAFPTDPPRLKAEKLMRAGLQMTEQRPWPAPWMLFFADAGGGMSGWFTLQQFRGAANSPDQQTWMRMTTRQRGEAFRAMYAAIFQQGIETARGTITVERYMEVAKGPAPSASTIRSTLGREASERYSRAADALTTVEPGYAADDILVGAWLHMMALKIIPFLSM